MAKRFIVIGAGIVGLSVARAARMRGHDVVVLDRGSVPNPQAASVDQHRMIRLHYGASEGYTRMVQQAFAAWEDLWRDLGVRHFEDTGALAVSVAAGDYADQTLATFRRLGIAHEVLDAAAVERLCPHLQMPEGATGLIAHPGGPLFADRIVLDLARLVSAAGVEIRAHTAAASVDTADGTVTTVDGERIRGDAAIIAAGAWLPALLPAEYGSLPTHRQTLCYVNPPRAYREAWRTGPAIAALGNRNVYTLPSVAGTGLKFGSGHQRRSGTPSPGSFTEPLQRGYRVIEDFGPYLRDAAAYTPVRMQVGYYVMDDSRRFRIERSGRRVVVTNCDGQMFKFGPLLGERLVAAIDGDDAAFDAFARWAAGA